MLETTVELSTASVPLAGLLKLAGLVGSGGEAKQVIQAADVRVNGTLEIRRGAKVRAGDVVVIEGEEPVRIRVTSAEKA
jgi:ribosome-associated protein